MKSLKLLCVVDSNNLIEFKNLFPVKEKSNIKLSKGERFVVVEVKKI